MSFTPSDGDRCDTGRIVKRIAPLLSLASHRQNPFNVIRWIMSTHSHDKSVLRDLRHGTRLKLNVFFPALGKSAIPIKT